MNRDVTVRGRRMHACLLGGGDTTIVLLSGPCVPLPQLEYRPLIKALAKSALVVLLEKIAVKNDGRLKLGQYGEVRL